MRRRRHPSLSLSPLSRRKSRFSSSFYLLRVCHFCREARAESFKNNLSLSSSIYYVSFILLWISNLIGRSFFKNLKQNKENFFKKNLTTLLNKKRAHTHITTHTRSSSSSSSSREGRCSISSSLCECVF